MSKITSGVLTLSAIWLYTYSSSLGVNGQRVKSKTLRACMQKHFSANMLMGRIPVQNRPKPNYGNRLTNTRGDRYLSCAKYVFMNLIWRQIDGACDVTHYSVLSLRHGDNQRRPRTTWL